MAEVQKVKTAIVGCGMISNIYAKNLANLFTVTDLVAVCDTNEAAAKQRATEFNIPKIMTLDEICEDPEIQIAVNLTGPAAHYSIIKKLLLAGKHVFTEKLLCFDLDEGKELVAIANEKNLYLGVAPDTFLGAGLQTARKVIDAGFIGKPTSAVAVINRNQSINSEFYRFIRGVGGSFPYDVGVYYVTALLSLLGPVSKVTGFVKEADPYKGRFLWNGDYGEEWQLMGSNLQSGSLLFESGAIANILFDGTTIDDEQPHFAIFGTEGVLYLGNPGGFDGSVTLVRAGGERTEIPFTHGFKGTPLYGEPGPCDWGGHRGVGVAEMAWSMLKGRPCRASKELGLHTLEVITGLDQSSATGTAYQMTTTFNLPAALPSGYLAQGMGGFLRADAEYALTL